MNRYVSSLMIFIATAFTALTLFTGCSDSELDEMPQSLQTFVTQYYPGISVSSYSEQNGKQYVSLQNSASFVFDSDNRWIDINGNGTPLPSDLLYDQLPETLYDYISTLEATNNVYRLQKTSTEIEVTLLNTSLSYDLSTHTIIQR